MRELSVFVTGISAFVEDFRRVVAVNAPEPVSMKVAGEKGRSTFVTIPAHLPYLRVPLNQVDTATQGRFKILHDWDVSLVPKAFPADGPNLLIRQTLVRFLKFYEVELPASDTEPDVNLTELNPTRLPTAADEQSLRWLTPMTSLGTSAVRIDPRHVERDPVDVAAYVRFPKGRISSAFVTNFKFESVTAADAKPAGNLDQAAAQLVVCRMNVPDEALTDGKLRVNCRGYNGAADFQIDFLPEVEKPWMVFACTSLEDAFQLRTERMFGVDHHFRLVYKLAEQDVRDTDIALPKSVPPPVGAGKPLGEGGCVPPVFSGGTGG